MPNEGGFKTRPYKKDMLKQDHTKGIARTCSLNAGRTSISANQRSTLSIPVRSAVRRRKRYAINATGISPIESVSPATKRVLASCASRILSAARVFSRDASIAAGERLFRGGGTTPP